MYIEIWWLLLCKGISLLTPILYDFLILILRSMGFYVYKISSSFKQSQNHGVWLCVCRVYIRKVCTCKRTDVTTPHTTNSSFLLLNIGFRIINMYVSFRWKMQNVHHFFCVCFPRSRIYWRIEQVAEKFTFWYLPMLWLLRRFLKDATTIQDMV